MKQCTTTEQTAKLIELGFEKPKGWEYPTMSNRYVMAVHIDKDPEFNYSIGELIEMLPKTITREIWWGGYKGKEGVWGLQIQTCGTEYSWLVSYVRECSAHLYLEGRSELIDALYDMIIKLKEEGVI